jgi:hypothetical protein
LYAHSSLSGSGAATTLQAHFKPALAGIVQADFLWGRGWVGMRYTHLDYAMDGVDAKPAAHSIGATLGFFYQFARHPSPSPAP